MTLTGHRLIFELKTFDPNNLSGWQAFLILAPVLSVFIPVVILILFREHQLARNILGGWNLFFWMLGSYVAVNHVAKKKLDEYVRKVDDSN
jgi:hypothetical protein